MSTEPERVETEIVVDVPQGYRDGARLDVYLTRSVANATRTKVQAAIRAGNVMVNGRVADRVSQVVSAGDHIVCTVMKPPPIDIVPEDLPIDLVYEDEFLLVVNKAPGMVVHPAHGHRSGTLVNALLHHVGAPRISAQTADDADDLGDAPEGDLGLSIVNAFPTAPGDESVRPGIVHRLDKDTSGLLVVAKNDFVHAALAKQFEERTTRRTYDAVVWGVTGASDRIDAPIGRSPRDRKKMAVVDSSRGKAAITRFDLVEQFVYTALLSVRLESGRTHQIRVHLSHAGHPVLGDETYGGRRIRVGPDTRSRRAFFQNIFALLPGQALHARTLGFRHPSTGEDMDFEVEPPSHLVRVIQRLREVEGAPA